MKKNKINYYALFRLFCSKDNPDFIEPFKQGDNYFATDSCSMIYMPCKNIKLNFKEKSINQIYELINIEKNMNIKINVNFLESKLIPEMIKKTNSIEKKCSECDGLGEVEYEYASLNGQTFTIFDDCPICSGSGWILTNEQNEEVYIPNFDKTYIINNVIYKYKYIKQLIETAKLIGSEKIVQTYSEEYKPSVFDMGNDITVLIMPVVLYNIDKKEIPVIC